VSSEATYDDALYGEDGSGYEPGLVFAFAGQGAQYPGMTLRLYLEHPTYRKHLDRAAEALLPYTRTSMVDLIQDADVRIHQTGFTQPALFAVEYALAATLLEAGVRPEAVIGHSIGEFAATVVSGALCLEEAAALVAGRGAYMQYLPSGGGMLACAAPLEDLAVLMAREPEVGVGAFNGPGETVLSGEVRALERIADRLASHGVTSTPLRVSHAFHSAQMRPMLDRYHALASGVRPGVPRLAFYSTVRGRRLEGESLDAAYWVEHVAAPVRFAPAADQLLRELRPRTIVEISPRTVLAQLLRSLPEYGASAADGAPRVVAACGGLSTGARDLDGVIEGLFQTA
jgi:[acyl-carrier-protein] S-malonyltransferase